MRLDLMPSRLPVPASPVYVALPGVGDPLAIGAGEFADHAARHAREQHAGRNVVAGQHDRSGRDQRAGADPGPAEHDRADADKRAFFYMRAVHGRVVTQAYPRLEPGRLARVDVQAAQILDVALLADEDLVIVGAQDGAVPDAGVAADGDRTDDDCARGDPGIRVDRGGCDPGAGRSRPADPVPADPVPADPVRPCWPIPCRPILRWPTLRWAGPAAAAARASR